MRRKYAIHPGFIGLQYISYPRLIELYGLRKEQCILWDDKNPYTFQGFNRAEMIHLYPDPTGEYRLPESNFPIKFLSWHKDQWLSREGSLLPWDKLEHFLIALIATLLAVHLLPWGWLISSSLVRLLGIANEIKDGIRPYDGIHVQGWSWKDLIANETGIWIGVLLAWVV